MALSHALLAALSHRAQTGYELARAFDESLGHFWQASHQQIYRELAKLEAGGLLSCELVEQQSRPDRKVYSLTTAGLSELKAWLAVPSKPAPNKDELLIRLYAGLHADRGILDAELKRELKYHQQKLAEYNQIEQHYFSGKLSAAGRLIWLTLQAGLAYERARIEWVKLALRTLAELQADTETEAD